MIGLILAVALVAQAPPITYPAGTYTITTPGPTAITFTATSVTFSWGPAPGPNPPVPPTPPPAPTPAPVPVLTGHVWAIAVYDPSATIPASQQAALTSQTLQVSSLTQDVDFQAHAKTDPNIASWISSLPPGGLPALLFIQKSSSGTGTMVYSTALPMSEPEILALINKVRGK